MSAKIRDWTPVEEGLPKDRGNVIVTTKWGISVGSWDGQTWTGRLGGDHVLNTVIAWQEFPDPWKKGRPMAAHWVRGEQAEGQTYYKCSVCGVGWWLPDDPDDGVIGYCYGCGAHLRGVEDD